MEEGEASGGSSLGRATAAGDVTMRAALTLAHIDQLTSSLLSPHFRLFDTEEGIFGLSTDLVIKWMANFVGGHIPPFSVKTC